MEDVLWVSIPQTIFLVCPILNMLYLSFISEIGYNKVQGVKSLLRYYFYQYYSIIIVIFDVGYYNVGFISVITIQV